MTARPLARRRIYHLEAEPFDAIGHWVDSFERVWEIRLDSLGELLDSMKTASVNTTSLNTTSMTTKGLTMASKQVDDEAAVQEKIASLPAYQDVAARLHEVIMRTAPDLEPRLWYGMPGYAKAKSSPVICFFRVDDHDYVTLGLTEKAHLAPDPDAGHQLIGSAWFLTDLDEATENRVADIVRSAVLGQTAPTPSPA